MRNAAAGVLALLTLFAGPAFSQQTLVKDTKHNLSASGTGTIKAASETQICVFCHTPHGSSSAGQLWNKTATSASYTPYSSDYLTSLAYPAAAALKPRSKLCMSCHDGTVALGSVYNLPGSGGAGTIAMTQSGSPITTMPSNATGYLGTSLTDDHPVGFLYDTVKDTQLQIRAWPWNTAVKLDPDASNGTVECQSCHEPHNNQFTKFLRMSNANAALCTHCHNKTNYAASIHSTSTQAYTPPGGTATTVGENSCRNCHKPHSSGGTPYVLRAVEQNTCYESGCHGTLNPGVNTTPASNNIQIDIAKTHRHPTNDTDGLHKNISGGESTTQLGSTNRHAECQDCHNPHQAQVAVPTATRGALRISDALKGTWGVEPSPWGSPPATMTNNNVTFVAPTGYVRVPNPTDEYQVCLKCHSNFVTLPVGNRNIAAEINNANSSYHGIVPGGVTNTFVNTTTINEPWATNKRVWCSDCHGRENNVSPTPSGVHGSNNNGTTVGTSNTDMMLIATIASTSSGTPLCLVCHKSTSYSTGNTGSRNSRHGTASMTSEGCFACHMWSNATLGGDGKIYPHGLNARWYTIYGGTAGSGSQQMVLSFNGGWYTNMKYDTKQCWAVNASGKAISGSPCGTHTGSGGTY